MGGGFPILPLAILFPKAEFTGLDATRKKVDAVQRIVESLGLTNVRLVLGRAEELGHDSLHREQYDAVLARAVAPLATLLELMSPFAKQKGTMICWKTLSIQEEMQESINARLHRTPPIGSKLCLPEQERQRHRYPHPCTFLQTSFQPLRPS